MKNNCPVNPRQFPDPILPTIVVALICLFAAVGNIAQTTSRPDRGFGSKGGYQTTEIDSISLQNGGLNVHIPLASLPPMAGGKLGYTLTAQYNDKLWNVHRKEMLHRPNPEYCGERYTTQEVQPEVGGAGWRLGAGYELFFRSAKDDYEYLDPYWEPCDGYIDTVLMNLGSYFKPMLRTPDGAEVELRFDGSIGTFSNQESFRDYLKNYYLWPGTSQTPVSNPIRFYSIDGSFIAGSYYPTGSKQGEIFLKDGTRIEQTTAGQRTIDTNGNSILMGSRTVGQVVESFIQDEQTGREIKMTGVTYEGQNDRV